MTRRRDKLYDSLEQANERIEQLEKLLARFNAKELLKQIPEALEDYKADLPERVLALGYVGATTEEIRAELGMTKAQWAQWRREHPTFKLATERAKDLAVAQITRRIMKAMNTNDHRFPIAIAQKHIEAMRSEEAFEDRGDASDLVKVDGTATVPARSEDEASAA